ncbi:histone H2B.3-like [Cucumis melo var. makuwa]|uniref:Histone H2B.3-like n=1 Tax=Cucumis melo var. makuwa TaxID=1194695 RepID=A0A5A7UNN6_CUCMM|nr:histone H2B.3-like [Cucumis melo var. makuwa]TYJ99946.1 histone H2B.3-like [Cucumis melo var. makuwa]
MLREALAPFHAVQQTSLASIQTRVEPQNVSNQLSTETNYLRDFKKYNLKKFDGSLEDPTKAQMWLASMETIFRNIKCPNNQKV